MDNTTAREIMSSEVLSANATMCVEDVLKLLVNNKITGLPVVDDKGKMVGIVSEYDILVQLSEGPKLKDNAFREPIRFTKKADAISETTPLDKIVELFVGSKYRRLPVVDKNDRLVGIITRRDLMRLFFYRAKLAG